MYQALIILQVLVGLGIISLVLIQQGKGADAGAAFGSGASGTVFGSKGSGSFLTRMTGIFATIFFVASLGLAILSGKQDRISTDLMDEVTPIEETTKKTPSKPKALDVPDLSNDQPDVPDTPAQPLEQIEE